MKTTVVSGLVPQAEFESLATTIEPHGFLLMIGVSFRVSDVEDKGKQDNKLPEDYGSLFPCTVLNKLPCASLMTK